jgi:uncharacterized protein (DUF305 family)
MKSKKSLAVTLIVLGALTFSGCSANSPLNSSSSETGTSEFTMGEVMFAQMMIPHHQQAVTMADLATSRTQNFDILQLAAAIKAAQEPEIEIMKSWLASDAETSDPHAGHDMGDSMSSGMSGMDGMLTDEQLDQLAAAQDEEFDKLFLSGMIAHHEGAIKMAEEIQQSKNSAVKNLANEIISSQKLEIEAMRALQK